MQPEQSCVVFSLSRWCRLNTSVNHCQSPEPGRSPDPGPGPPDSGPGPLLQRQQPTQNVDARYNIAAGGAVRSGDSGQQGRGTTH